MKTFQLNGTARTDLGKKAVKGLRKQGLIPAVLNGGELVELPYIIQNIFCYFFH